MRYELLPQFLQIELTYGCNSSCVFCYNPNHRKQPDEAVRDSIIRTVNSYRIPHVQLIGGEVSTLPRLPEYLQALDKVRWRSFVTNGRIFVDGAIGHVDEIYLSLHGDQDTHESLTRAKDSFALIEENIQRYIAAGIMVHSDTVLTKMNADQIYGVCEKAHKLGMESVFVNIFQSAGIGSFSVDSMAPSLAQIRDAITQMIAAKRDFGITVRFGTSTPYCIDERLISEGMAFTCGTGTWFASINPWGELRICNQSTRSYGNVLEKPLHEIWHGTDINKEYRDLSWLPIPCKECPAKNTCYGGCRISATGTPRVDPLVSLYGKYLVPPERLVELMQQHGVT